MIPARAEAIVVCPGGVLPPQTFVVAILLVVTGCWLDGPGVLAGEGTATPMDGTAEPAAILRTHCVRCHSGKDAKGGLDLSQRESALRGGDSGPAIVAGDPDESLLIQRARAGSMPPINDGRELNEPEIEVLSNWIARGASWLPPIEPDQPSLRPDPRPARSAVAPGQAITQPRILPDPSRDTPQSTNGEVRAPSCNASGLHCGARWKRARSGEFVRAIRPACRPVRCHRFRYARSRSSKSSNEMSIAITQ